mmetsp:Transcript_670/g.1601  ORF Transcript_670/g.1601 Transcript_670/m.1601 type:complete len:334 (+) Transcript_670:325-1326(+)
MHRCVGPHDPVSARSSAALEQIEGNDPFFSLVVSPQLGARQEEEPPVDVPLVFLSFAVGFGQDGLELSGLPALVEVGEPSVAGLFVVLSIDPPVVGNRELIGKVKQEVVAGHGSSREKVVAHPSLFEFVAKILVGEDVDKELSGGLEPLVDLVEEDFVVFHVLKHFDRHDQIVVLHDVESALVVGDVAGNDGDVLYVESAFSGGLQDVFSLGAAVGNSGDFGVGIIFRQVQGQAPPSASEINNLHAVHDAGVFAILLEHGHLRFLKGAVLGRPEPRAVLLAGSQAQVVELGGDLVVLVVGLVGGNGNGHRLEFLDDGELLVQFLRGALAGQNV